MNTSLSAQCGVPAVNICHHRDSKPGTVISNLARSEVWDAVVVSRAEAEKHTFGFLPNAKFWGGEGRVVVSLR
jgi:hypothetical protein